MTDAHRPPGTQRPRAVPAALPLGAARLRGARPRADRDSTRRGSGPRTTVVAREHDGVRWYRCVRCDSWLPLPPPDDAAARAAAGARGDRAAAARQGAARPDRAARSSRSTARSTSSCSARSRPRSSSSRRTSSGCGTTFYRIVNAIQGTSMQAEPADARQLAPPARARLRAQHDDALRRRGGRRRRTRCSKAVEAVGLWYQKRWAEYLTFVATCLLSRTRSTS